MIFQGFAPSFYNNQNSAGLQIYIASGRINNQTYNGVVVTMVVNPMQPTTTNYISVDNFGNVTSSILGYASANPIALVVTGKIITSGNTANSSQVVQSGNRITTVSGPSLATFSDGVISISDTRLFA